MINNYCVNDTYFENVTQIVFYTTLSKQKMGEYQENYFFDGLKLKKEKKLKEKKDKKDNNIINISKKRKEEDRYNISIERRPHYCSHASEDINNNKKKEENIENNIDMNNNKKNEENIGNNIDINKEIETNIILNNNNNDENNNDKDKKINNSNTPTTSSIKSDSEEVNYEEDMK